MGSDMEKVEFDVACFDRSLILFVKENEKDAAIAEAFVKKYYKNIVEKWVNFFIYKKRIRSTKITKKL